MIDQKIALGMYSVSEELECTWQDLLLKASDLYPEIGLPKSFVNSIEESVVLDKNTCISHMCGLPLIDRFSEVLMPLCAPQFNLPGVFGPQYFSYYIVHRDSEVDTIAHSKGKRLAANSECSNSGLNVLRHELREKYKECVEVFFGEIIFTGSHHKSLHSILKGVCDVTAIDAATYEYLCVTNPLYRDELRIIGQSCQSTAPPLVTNKNRPLCSPQLLTKALNSALNSLDQTTRNTLNIRQFHKVELQDYTSQLLD